MRRSLVALAALAALLLACTLLTTSARAAGGHDDEAQIVLDDLTVPQRQLATQVWSIVICKCERENWSKTLLNCPDGCADWQKQEILRAVRAGWTEDQILADQRRKYGPKAIGRPDDVWTYALPVLMLLGAGTIVLVVFRRWRHAAEENRAARLSSGRAAHDEIDAVERELRELR